MEQSAVRSSITRRTWYRMGGGLMVAALIVGFIGPARSQISTDMKFSGSATGTILHAGLIKSGATKLVDANVAFTGAAFNSKGLANASFNEMQRQFSPANVKKLAFGRGVGLDAGLAATPNKPNQIILAGLAEIAAPLGGVVTKQIGPLDLGPLAWANVLRGRAQAADADDNCIIGSDMSSSLAYVADAQLLDMGSSSSGASSSGSSSSASAASAPGPVAQVANTVQQVTQPVRGLLSQVTQPVTQAAPAAAPVVAPVTKPQASSSSKAAAAKPVEGLAAPIVALDAAGPARAVSASLSRTVLVAQRNEKGQLLGQNFGVMSEVHETIAPVTLFKGTPSELTLEFLGKWTLRAVATGMPGGAYIHYGPGAVTPSTPVLRLLDSTGVTDVLTLQDLLGTKGLVIEIPGLAEIAIGEDARAIGGNADSVPSIAANGTSAAGAVDVVRVKLLPGAPAELTDLRIGHMEVRAAAPEGGVRCSIPVKKYASTKSANVGDAFHVDIKVTNPYDCTLSDVRVTDAITTEKAARFEVGKTTPSAASFTPGSGLDAGTIKWNVGSLAPHASKVVSASFEALGGTGTILDRATASGVVGNCRGQGATASGVGVTAVDAVVHGATGTVEVPVSGGAVVAGINQTRQVPLTGAPIALLVTIALALLAAGGAALTLAYRFR
jgi:uncharacterized protein DUF11